MKFFKKFFSSRTGLIFISIVLVGVVLRFWKLGAIPDGLNRDEASLGYTAYTILKTGADEYGKSWPVNIQSFGDWKLPLYVYLSIPIIQVFGLSSFTVRFLSALSGCAIVILVFVLAKLLVKKWNAPDWLPLITSGLIAISPWAIHLSRVAYEANVALSFCLLGIVCWFLSDLYQRKWLIVAAGIFFGLTMVGYHAFQVFTPLIILWSIWIFREEFKQRWKSHKIVLVLSLMFFVLPIGLLFANKAVQSNQTKYAGISIFSEKIYDAEQAKLNSVITARGFSFLQPFYSSRIVLISQHVINNVVSILNPNFLFISGGSHGSHNVPRVSNLYAISFLTVLVGIAVLLTQRKRWQIWIMGWLMLSSIAPLLTIEANHSVRFFPAIFALQILSAVGFGYLWTLKKYFRPFLVGLFGLSAVHFVISYFIVFPSLFVDNWPWYMDQIVQVVESREKGYARIFMQGESSSPYIFFLFNQPDRVVTQHQTISYYPPTEEGFTHVQQLNNIYFQKIDWAEIEQKQEPILLIVRPKEIPGDKLTNPRYKVIQEISRPYSETTYQIMEYK